MAPASGTPSNGTASRRKPEDIRNMLDQHVDVKKVNGYNPRTEEAPKSVTHTEQWAVLQDGNMHIFKLINKTIEDSSCTSDVVMGLQKYTHEKLLDLKQEKTIVCISGNMGGGKSATINSCFQVGDIAKEGDSGASCTLSSQSFNPPLPDQTAPFLAEVIFFDPNERREILEGYVRDYFRADNSMDDDGQGGEDSDDNPAIKDEVTNVLVTLFRDHPECSTKKNARRFLEDANSEDDPVILNTLLEWTEAMIRRAQGKSGKVLVTASTAGQLLGKLEEFATEVDAEDGSAGSSLWPLVSCISFHFHDPLTDTGIIFLDTPGLTDHNKTRRMSALKYARKKTHAMIVTDVARARDDPSVSAEVKAMKSRGRGRVVVVSPKSHVIGDSTIPSGSKREKDMIVQFKKVHDDFETRLAEIEESILKCEDDGDDDQAAQLNQQKRKLEVLVKTADNAEKAHRINMRSEQNKSKLQEKLQDVAAAGDTIPVFSISNKAYAQHLAGYNPKKTPVLTVEETNIPELRRLLFTFPNEARLNEARFHQEGVIPTLIDRLRLYTSRTPFERKGELEKHVNAPYDKFAGLIDDSFDQLRTDLQNLIANGLKNEESTWSAKATAKCLEWEDKFKTGPFMTLMTRLGHRRESKNNPKAVNLSGDLAKLNATQIDQFRARAVKHEITLTNGLKAEILELFRDMIKEMQGDSNSAFVELGPFFKHVNNLWPQLHKAIDQMSEAILDGLDFVHIKAISADPDSYIAAAMEPVYEKVRALKGKTKVKNEDGTETFVTNVRPKCGWPTHRKNVFKQEVTKVNGIWASVYNGVEADIQDLLENERKTLKDAIGHVFNEYKEGFKLMCPAEETLDPAEEALQQTLGDILEKAEAHRAGPMQEAFDTLCAEFRRKGAFI